MRFNRKYNLVRSLLTCLSLLSASATLLSACGEDSSLVGNWALTSVNGQPVEAADTAIMQIESDALTANELGCSGNIRAKTLGDKLSFNGYDVAEGCRIEFLRPVQINRARVHDVLALNPKVTRDLDNPSLLVVEDSITSTKLVFAPASQ